MLFCSTGELTCTESEFACRDHSGCIDAIKQCDINVDCADGSDERDCGKLMYIICQLVFSLFTTIFTSHVKIFLAEST